MQMQAALIVNGRARRGKEWYELARREFGSRDVNLTLTRLVNRPRQVESAVREAIEAQIPLVCVGGGDGTLNMVAGLFKDTNSVLGVLPMGTGNSLARDLGIPAVVSDAVDIALEGRTQAIDLGQVNGVPFVNVATVGLTTLIAENLDPTAKRRFGRAVYLVAMFRAVLQGRRFHLRLELPDGVQEHRSIQVVVGNGRFHAGPFPITPEAQIDSGYLSGYTVNTSRKSVLLRYAMRLWHGRHIDMEEVVPFCASELKLVTTPAKRITVDGEIRLRTPGEFRSLSGVLRVRMPLEPLQP
jgi:diacylglycerol kinase (ATP)